MDEIKDLAGKLGIPEEEIEEEVANMTTILKENLPEATDDEIKARAISLIYQQHREEVMAKERSPAETYVGFVFGNSGVMDSVANLRRQAFDKYFASPLEALEQKIVMKSDANDPRAVLFGENSWIVPLDSRESFSGSGNINPSFGKPLPVTKLTKWVNLLLKTEAGLKPAVLMLRGDNAKLPVPMFKVVQCEAILSDRPGFRGMSQLIDSPSQTTGFKVVDSGENVDPEELLENEVLEQFWCPMEGMPERTALEEQMFDRMVITEADVVDFSITDTSRRLILHAEFQSNLSCFVPAELEIDFGKYSRVIVVGRASDRDYMGKKSIQMSLFGAFARPKYKMPLAGNYEMPKSEQKAEGAPREEQKQGDEID
jgi:hypothetical protein